MSHKAGAAKIDDVEDEISLEPCTTDTVFSTPYRDLLACNGMFSFLVYCLSSLRITANKYRQL
jgi:hypothetical protein